MVWHKRLWLWSLLLKFLIFGQIFYSRIRGFQTLQKRVILFSCTDSHPDAVLTMEIIPPEACHTSIFRHEFVRCLRMRTKLEENKIRVTRQKKYEVSSQLR